MRSLCVCGKSASAAASMVSSGIGPIAEDQRLTQIIRHAPSDATPSEMDVERASTKLSSVVLHPGPEEPVADLEDPEDHELDEERFPKEKEVFVPRIEIIGPMACATSPMPSAASTYRAEAAQAAQAAEQVQRSRFAATSLTSGPMTEHVSSANSAVLTEPMINFGAARTTTDVQSLVSAAADVPAPVQQPVEETDVEGEAAVKRTEEQTGKAVGTVVQEPAPSTGTAVADAIDIEVAMVTVVDFEFANLDYNKAASGGGGMLVELGHQVQEAIASKVAVPVDSVEVQLKPGSIRANACISCAHLAAADAMKAKVDSDADGFLQMVDHFASKVPDITSAMYEGSCFGLRSLRTSVQRTPDVHSMPLQANVVATHLASKEAP